MLGLITQLDDDDRAFMLNLYKNYYKFARKNIFSITHNNEDIEDLIDEVFIKIIEKIQLIRTFDSCKATSYIAYTTRSVAINYIKHKKVENKHIFYCEEDIAETFFASDDKSEERLIKQEEMEELSKAIRKLPQNQKDLLYFKYILEMSDKDIAEIFGIETNSIRQYLTRARRNAKKLIETEATNYA